MLHQDPAAREKLTNMLLVCYDGLKTYGKEPEQLNNLNKLFQLVLADYTIDQIEAAMRYYMKHNTEMPAPADIATIIDRGNKPPFDRSVYVSISKKHAEDRSPSDWQYMRDYERFIVSGKY